MAGVVYVYFVKENYPESLTGYAVDKHMNELLKIDQLRSTLQVKFRLGVTSNLSHNVYSQHMTDFEVKYLGGFDSQNQAKILINSLNNEQEGRANVAPDKTPAEKKKHSWGTGEKPKVEKKDIPLVDTNTDTIFEPLKDDIKDSGFNFGPVLED